jgi:hypothetical protein
MQIGYRVVENPIPHTCWADPECEGVMMEGCAGCDEAEKFPCQYCGYGHIFTTHSEAHVHNGDRLAPDFYGSLTPEQMDAWADAPHIYDEGSSPDGPRPPIRLPRRTDV